MRWWTLGLLWLLTACTPHLDPSPAGTQEQALSMMLLDTLPPISRKQATKLSREAIRYSKKLAARYKITTPPLVHNFLVNVGIKNRGLCYQWSDDLYMHLQNLHLRSIQLKPVGANIGKYWTEHNALVVLPTHDNRLDHGVLLDPWRHAGVLYFVPISKDPVYHWQIRTDRYEVYTHAK